MFVYKCVCVCICVCIMFQFMAIILSGVQIVPSFAKVSPFKLSHLNFEHVSRGPLSDAIQCLGFPCPELE